MPGLNMSFKACPSVQARGRCHSISVHARFGRDSGLILGPGGNDGSNNFQRAKEARLIIPGQQRPAPGGGRPQRILSPDKQQGARPGGEGSFLPDESSLGLVSNQALPGGPPMLNKYRPPAGFMNETLPDDSTANTDPQEMLNKLRSRAGHWHDLAKFIPALNSKGYSAAVIDELTGITPAEQNKWVVSGTVYESVKASPAVPREVLSRFDGAGVDLLYPFRFLSAERRVAAAQYIVAQNLDAAMCEVLARAMKEFERRPQERAGFSEAPGDCLAFKYLRDALECRKREDAVLRVDQGLAVAVTEEARQRLQLELLAEEGEAGEGGTAAGGGTGAVGAAAAGSPAPLVLLRLNPDELGVRPVCVVGELGQAQPEDLLAAPRTTQSGAFGIFCLETQQQQQQQPEQQQQHEEEAPREHTATPSTTTQPSSSSSASSPPRSWSWVALPAWRALAMSRHPLALTLRDCAAVQAVLAGSRAKTDDDKRRLQGPGILVVDKAPATFETLDESAWYLGVPEGARALQMVQGRQAAALATRGSLFASVLFLARPPVMEVADRGTDLLQL
ncbi:hypothetical protein Agub_g11075 [Astrephomene gubernaculifera]|uniref:Uncharacterized protein n=1 Tax=Astrephomene gubernaculifera TaxID=47775 RepID=A0AAD3DVV3_9CHLO|nr:hypothetical protein Agub_g11075 [Astrephomene gubernaculifera]